VLEELIGESTDREDFFGDYLDERPLLVELDERSGEGRERWIKRYRTFVRGEKIDALLEKNISAAGGGALVYGNDVEMRRPVKVGSRSSDRTCAPSSHKKLKEKYDKRVSELNR